MSSDMSNILLNKGISWKQKHTFTVGIDTDLQIFLAENTSHQWLLVVQ